MSKPNPNKLALEPWELPLDRPWPLVALPPPWRTPYDVYLEGRAARVANPDAVGWEGVLPYSVPDLVHSWLDGWRDEAGDYHWWPGGHQAKSPTEVPWGALGGRCPWCTHYPMTDLPDGVLRCRACPCRERNYPPVDPERSRRHRAFLEKGGGI